MEGEGGVDVQPCTDENRRRRLKDCSTHYCRRSGELSCGDTTHLPLSMYKTSLSRAPSSSVTKDARVHTLYCSRHRTDPTLCMRDPQPQALRSVLNSVHSASPCTLLGSSENKSDHNVLVCSSCDPVHERDMSGCGTQNSRE